MYTSIQPLLMQALLWQLTHLPNFQPSPVCVWEEWWASLLVSGVLQGNRRWCCSTNFSNIECFLQQMITTSGFVCPGIRDYPASIRFNTKLVVWSEPFNRRFSVNCSQWHGMFPTMPSRLRGVLGLTAVNHASNSFMIFDSCSVNPKRLLHQSVLTVSLLAQNIQYPNFHRQARQLA